MLWTLLAGCTSHLLSPFTTTFSDKHQCGLVSEERYISFHLRGRLRRRWDKKQPKEVKLWNFERRNLWASNEQARATATIFHLQTSLPKLPSDCYIPLVSKSNKLFWLEHGRIWNPWKTPWLAPRKPLQHWRSHSWIGLQIRVWHPRQIWSLPLIISPHLFLGSSLGNDSHTAYTWEVGFKTRDHQHSLWLLKWNQGTPPIRIYSINLNREESDWVTWWLP